MRSLGLPAEDWRLLAGGAILTTAAYPPFHLILPSFLCVIPAVFLLRAASTAADPGRRWLAQGFWYGVLTHLFVLSWLPIALWRLAPVATLVFPVALVGLGLLGAAVFSLAGWTVRRTGAPLLVVFPTAWTAGEWVAGHCGDLRFPWLGLGTSLTGFPALVQVADTVGARGVTWMLAAANTALALAWLRRRDRVWALRVLAATVVGAGAVAGWGGMRVRQLEAEPVARLAVLRSDVPPRVSWDSAAVASAVASLLRTARAAVAEGAELVVWPEASVPVRLPDSPAIAPVRAFAAENRVPQLVGAYWSDAATGRVYNAGVLVDAAGRLDAFPIHRKRYLVAVVERVPFVPAAWLDRLGDWGGTAAGPAAPIVPWDAAPFATLICFESTVERASRDARRRGAAFLVNITNDAWFLGTAGAAQHEAHLVMRAIETRAGIARAANGSPAALIDPTGRVRVRTDTIGFAVGEVLTVRAPPLYTRWGDWVGTLSVLVMVGLSAAAMRRP